MRGKEKGWERSGANHVREEYGQALSPTSTEAPSEFIARALAHHGIHKIPVDHEIALASTALPDLHNDPFDRILVATAQARNLRLVSKAAQLARYRLTSTPPSRQPLVHLSKCYRKGGLRSPNQAFWIR
jgi:hypothetical protein